MALEPGMHPKDYYGSFNRRMWAITFDSIVFYILYMPLMQFIEKFYPKEGYTVDLVAFQQELATKNTPMERLSYFWHTLNESGYIARFFVDSCVQMGLFFLLIAICWKLWSSTPGKMILRMKVVDAKTEASLSNKQIVLRLLGYIVSGVPLLIGYFWMSFDKRHQGWHDKIAGTVVIIKPKSAAGRP